MIMYKYNLMIQTKKKENMKHAFLFNNLLL